MPSYTIRYILTYSTETKSPQLFLMVNTHHTESRSRIRIRIYKTAFTAADSDYKRRCAYLPGFLGAELDERRPAQEESEHVGHDVIDHHH
jgi:hypothetical protein